MSEDFLSQEEIDSLLGSEDEEESGKGYSKPVPFDFSNTEHIKKGGAPGLDLILERWIKIFRDDIRSIIPKVNMITKESTYITRFNNFMSKIPMPCSYTIATMKPLKESFLFILDSRLVFVIISTYFGGPAKPFKVEGREFTKLETRIIKDIATTALTSFQKVWQKISPMEIHIKSIELNPNLAKIVPSTEKVIVVELSMEIDGYEAPFFLCFPHEMFLPMKEIIYSEAGLSEKDPIWEKKLAEKLLSIKVKVWLELARKKLKLSDILEWQKETEINLDVSEDNSMWLYVEDEPKFKAKLGKLKNKYAALITQAGEDKHGGNKKQPG